MTDGPAGGHALVVSTQSALAHTLAPEQVASRPTLDPLVLPAPTAEARARSFRGLYEAEVDFVWRNLRRLGVHASEVEDRTQEVFVVAHRRFDDFEDRGHGPRACDAI